MLHGPFYRDAIPLLPYLAIKKGTKGPIGFPTNILYAKCVMPVEEGVDI